MTLKGTVESIESNRRYCYASGVSQYGLARVRIECRLLGRLFKATVEIPATHAHRYVLGRRVRLSLKPC